MILSFTNIYYKYDDEILNIYFYNRLKFKFLFFDGGFFYKKNESLDTNSNEVIEIRENEDFDFYILLGQKILIKIFFYPDDKSINGVSQIFKIMKPSNKEYNIFWDDFVNHSKDLDFEL